MEELGLINRLLKQRNKTPLQELKELLNSPPPPPGQKYSSSLPIQRILKLKRGLDIRVPDDCRCDGDKIGYKDVLG